MAEEWYRRTDQGWTLAVHVQPGAKRSEVAGLHGKRLKVRIAAAAVENRANEALADLVAGRLNVARAKVRILRGQRSREKLVAILEPTARPEDLLHGARSP